MVVFRAYGTHEIRQEARHMARAKRIKSEAEQEQTTEAREALTPIPAPEPEPPKPKNKGGRPRKVKPEAEATAKEIALPSKPLTQKGRQAAKPAAKPKLPQEPEALKVERKEEPSPPSGIETSELEKEQDSPSENETPEKAEPSPLVTAFIEPAPPMEPEAAKVGREEVPVELPTTHEEAAAAPSIPMEPGEESTPAIAETVVAHSTVKATSRPTDRGVPMKPNPLYVETKSKRVQLMLQPSVYDGARKLAEADGLSFNEFVHRKLEEAISRKDEQ
jgi:hypothetical protein